MDILAELEKLRRSHYICDEDCWYSCPLSGNCCDHEREKKCNCGADKYNAILDGIIAELKKGMQ